MARSPDPQKRQQWQQRIARYRRGKQTVSAFCAAEEISVTSFYQWRRRLSVKSEGGEAVPSPAESVVPRFQPVLVTSGAGPRVRLPGGVVIETGDDLEALALVLDRLLGDGGVTPC